MAEDRFLKVDTSHAQYDSAQIYLKWAKAKTDSIDKIGKKKLNGAMAELSKIIRATNKDFNQPILSSGIN